MNTIDDEEVVKFESLLEELRKQLLDACVHFDIWVQLFPTAPVVGVINQYRGFFQPTRQAHLDRFFIKVSNAVSNDPRSPSFHRIFKMLDNNPALASGVNVRSLRKRLKQHKKVLEGIKEYRDKKGAHWDTQVLAERQPVLFGDSKRMLKELQDMFNEICGAHSGNVWAFKYSQQSNTTGLLNALKLWRQQNPSVKFSREVEMSRREELSREHAKWTRKYVEADNRLKALLPKVANLSAGEKMEPWVVTEERLAEYDKVQKEVEEAQHRLREIMDELTKLST